MNYEVVIIGAGLAGLSMGILLQQQGVPTLLLEKSELPRHKVCGEFVSHESTNFLERLGIEISSGSLPHIYKLLLSHSSGVQMNATLPLGGRGISRYSLEEKMREQYLKWGGVLKTKTKVYQVSFNELHEVKCTDGQSFSAKVLIGSWGKRSNLDVELKRPFIQDNWRSRNEFVGVKYHVYYPVAEGEIALHLFEGGYCGLSRIENDKVCLCYLVKSKMLKNEGSIEALERNVLVKNPQLKVIFQNAEKIFSKPLSIAQISFEKKEPIIDHILLPGDSAGLITPLTGNGMSIAMQSADLLAGLVTQFLNGQLSRVAMEEQYRLAWNQHFAGRMRYSRWMQEIFYREAVVKNLIKAGNAFPFLSALIIKKLQGKPF